MEGSFGNDVLQQYIAIQVKDGHIGVLLKGSIGINADQMLFFIRHIQGKSTLNGMVVGATGCGTAQCVRLVAMGVGVLAVAAANGLHQPFLVGSLHGSGQLQNSRIRIGAVSSLGKINDVVAVQITAGACQRAVVALENQRMVCRLHEVTARRVRNSRNLLIRQRTNITVQDRGFRAVLVFPVALGGGINGDSLSHRGLPLLSRHSHDRNHACHHDNGQEQA